MRKSQLRRNSEEYKASSKVSKPTLSACNTMAYVK